MNIDLVIFNAINQFAGRWQWLDAASIFFARHFEYVLLASLVVMLAMDYKKYWKAVAVALAGAGLVRIVLVELIRVAWFRPRPFVFHEANVLVPYNIAEASFPSGHASFYFAIAAVLYGYNKKIGAFFYIGSALIAASRVLVGIHWPSDILAGAGLGIVAGWAMQKIFKKSASTKIKTA